MSGAAPIYSFTDDPARSESAAWARFSAAKDNAEFCSSWLAILCLQIERVGGGLLLLGPDKDGAFVPAAGMNKAKVVLARKLTVKAGATAV